MLPRSNARTSRGDDVLILASFEYPEGDAELVHSLFETNDRFFIVHPKAANSGHPFRSALYEPMRLVTRQMLIDLYRTYHVALATGDNGYVEIRSWHPNVPTSTELEAARQEAFQYAR